MQPDEEARVARLERQVAFLCQHLALDPDLAAGGGQTSTFRSPAEIFGTPAPGYGTPPSGAGAPAAVSSAAGGADDVSPAVLAAIQRGRMIEAIKIYRETTGLGLREAKRAVEEIARRQP